MIWQYRAGQGSALGGIEWGSAADERIMYVPVSDVLRAEAGGLHAIGIGSGERIWHTPAPRAHVQGRAGLHGAQSAAISVIPGVVFSGSVDGHIRAYDTGDGHDHLGLRHRARLRHGERRAAPPAARSTARARRSPAGCSSPARATAAGAAGPATCCSPSPCRRVGLPLVIECHDVCRPSRERTGAPDDKIGRDGRLTTRLSSSCS